MPNCAYFFIPIKSEKIAKKWLRKANSKKWRRHGWYGVNGITNHTRASTIQDAYGRDALWYIKVRLANGAKAVSIRHPEGWLHREVDRGWYFSWEGADNVSFFSFEAFKRGLISLHLKSKREVDTMPYHHPNEPWRRAPAWRGGNYLSCQLMLREARRFFDEYPEGAVHVYGFDPPAIYL